MKVLLVDVDSKIPNLALMKVSAWHKAQGDDVGFKTEDPDLVYVSVVFRRNLPQARNVGTFFPRAKVLLGGVGANDEKLPPVIEQMKPDYDLYPSTYSQGYTTRGCIRKCYFCRVPQLEGPLQRWQHPSEFHDFRFNEMMVMDNNWLADREWFLETSSWIIEHDLRIREHGLDVRLIDKEIAQQLLKFQMTRPYHFAFDMEEQRVAVEKKILLLQEAGFELRHNVVFYIYVHNDAQFDSALRRCNLLKKWGTNPFVMFNIDAIRTQRIKDLQHWANRKQLFWSVDFADYQRGERWRLPEQKRLLR